MPSTCDDGLTEVRRQADEDNELYRLARLAPMGETLAEHDRWLAIASASEKAQKRFEGAVALRCS